MVSAGQAHEADSVSWTFLWAVFALQARSRRFEPSCAHWPGLMPDRGSGAR